MSEDSVAGTVWRGYFDRSTEAEAICEAAGRALGLWEGDNE